MKSFRKEPPIFDFLAYYSSIIDSSTPSDALERTINEFDRFLYDIVYKNGNPLVVKNMHHHPLWNRHFENDSMDIFSFQFLDKIYGKQGRDKDKYLILEISLRDTDARTDISGYTLSSYLSYLKLHRSKRNPKNLYGKDLSCPKEWTDLLSEIISPSIKMKGPNDLLRYLPVEIQPETLMVYIGGHGTHTPFHVDVCGSLGHNILVAKSGSKAHALWTIVPAKWREHASKYWGGIEYVSDDDPNVIIKPSKIGYPNAIELDGLLIEDEDEFINAPFPLFRFSQDVGDLVIIPPDSPHQVQNINGSTIKVAWNKITPETLDSFLFTIGKSYSRLCKREVYRTRATCHHSVLSLTTFLEGLWLCQSSFDQKKALVPASIVANVSNLVSLVQTYQRLIFDEHIEQLDSPTNTNPFIRGNSLTISGSMEIKSKEKFVSENYRLSLNSIKLYVQLVDLEQELPHTRICDACQRDLLNRFFHCSECISTDDSSIDENTITSKFKPRLDGIDLCFECYTRGRFCKHPIMTLMQTFETNDGPYLIAKRAINCIKNWSTRIAKFGILKLSPSSNQDLENITSFTCKLHSSSTASDASKATKNISMGTLAFNILLGRANNLINGNGGVICFICQKDSCSNSEYLVSCKSCENKICHLCLWNKFAIDPFDAIKGNGFQCFKCLPLFLTCFDLSSKKVEIVLPWIGCSSFGASYSNSNGHASPSNGKLTYCFFDKVIMDVTKKLSSIPNPSAKGSYKQILVSFFEKSSETCNFLQLKRKEKKKKIQEEKDNFESCLLANIDVGLGLAIKQRMRNKKQCLKTASKLASLKDEHDEKRSNFQNSLNNIDDFSGYENVSKHSRSSIPKDKAIQSIIPKKEMK